MFNLIISTITVVISVVMLPNLPDGWFFIGLMVSSGCGWQFGENLQNYLRK